MTKVEFLSLLRGRITGSIPTSEVESQLDYYSAYIDGRIGAGLTEEEAVAELGDPQLIAKTVIESTDRAAEAAGYDGRYRSSTDTYDDSDGINSGIFGNSGPSREAYYDRSAGYEGSRAQGAFTGNRTGQQEQNGAGNRTGSSLGCIIAVIVLILIMALAWVLTSFVFRLSFRLLGWLFPVIAIAGLVYLVVRLLRGR